MFYLYLVLHNLIILYFHLPYFHSANFAVIQALLQLYQAVNDLVSNLVIPRVDATGSSWWVLVQVMASCHQDIAWPILTQICVTVWRHRDIVDTYIPFCNVGVNLKCHSLRWWQQGVSLTEQQVWPLVVLNVNLELLEYGSQQCHRHIILASGFNSWHVFSYIVFWNLL